MNNHTSNRPVVGLLYNPAVPYIIEDIGDMVEYIEVIPDRFWYDFGIDCERGRFHKLPEAIDIFKRCAEGRTVAGHGIGLSLPSAMPIDRQMLDEVAFLVKDLGLSWYSEHLSMFLTPHSSVPNSQAGLGLPVVYDEETFVLLREKLGHLRAALGCPVLIENGNIFTSIPEMEMTEPEFLNRLHREADCGILLDLHNLYVTWRNGNVSPDEYLSQIDPDAVQEIHMAGGDMLAGFYTDSHSRRTPEDVWSWALEHALRFKNLRAIIFEFHESYFDRLGMNGIAEELARLHDLADKWAAANTAGANTAARELSYA